MGSHSWHLRGRGQLPGSILVCATVREMQRQVLRDIPVSPGAVDDLFRQKSLQEIHGILQTTRAQVEAKKTELRELVGDHYRSVLESSDHIRAMSECAVQVAQGAEKLETLIGTMRELAAKPPQPDDQCEPETEFSLCEHVMEVLEMPDKVRSLVAELSFVKAAKAALVDAPALHAKVQQRLRVESLPGFDPQGLISQQAAAFRSLPRQVAGGCVDAFATAELTPAAAAEAFVAHLVLNETAASSLLRRFIECRSNLLRDILEGSGAAFGGDSKDGLLQRLCAAAMAFEGTIVVASSLCSPGAGGAPPPLLATALASLDTSNEILRQKAEMLFALFHGGGSMATELSPLGVQFVRSWVPEEGRDSGKTFIGRVEALISGHLSTSCAELGQLQRAFTQRIVAFRGALAENIGLGEAREWPAIWAGACKLFSPGRGVCQDSLSALSKCVEQSCAQLARESLRELKLVLVDPGEVPEGEEMDESRRAEQLSEMRGHCQANISSFDEQFGTFLDDVAQLSEEIPSKIRLAVLEGLEQQLTAALQALQSSVPRVAPLWPAKDVQACNVYNVLVAADTTMKYCMRWHTFAVVGTICLHRFGSRGVDCKPLEEQMIREEAMVIEWSSDPHPADRGELWDSSLHDEIHKLRVFVEGQFKQQGELLKQLNVHAQQRRLREARDARASSQDSAEKEKSLPTVVAVQQVVPPALGSSPEGSKTKSAENKLDLSGSSANVQQQDVAGASKRHLGEANEGLLTPTLPSPTLSLKDLPEDHVSVKSPRSEDLKLSLPGEEARKDFKRGNSASLASAASEQEKEIELNSPSAVANWIMRSPVFIYGIMFVILFNLVSLGIEVDIAAKVGQNDVPKYFDYMNLIVVIIFLMELAVNVTANGLYKFLCGGDWLWNFFDVVIVALSALETGISFTASSGTGTSQVSPSHLRFMRPIRLARALRGVRVMRLFRYVGALRTLLLSIMSSIASLFWTIVLLVLLFYSFGVLLTQLVSDYCRDRAIAATLDLNAAPDCSDLAYGRYWTSVGEAMLTLFMSISGGIDWDDALVPLQTVSPIAVTAMLLYIVITVFTVVNVVTGVFCNTAIESAAADKDIAVMKQMRKHAAQVQVLRNVFREIDEKSNKSISMEDLQEAMLAHKLSSFFESMGIATQDVMTLFQIIDSDGSGSIDVDEFVTGCMRLHGPAKSLDVAKMGFENEITKVAIKDVEETLQVMKEQLSTLLKTQKGPTQTNHGFAV
eukprot:symbB.v1.2.028412.t1/scaffold2968.1/size66330/2